MDEPSAFFDRTALTYDGVVEQIESAGGWAGDDVPFYHDLARSADGPALEVGVGTGRVYLELLRDGLDVDGIDVSDAMLERLRTKAATEGLDPSVRLADVTDLVTDREYGLVYCPARAFNHLETLDAQRAAVRRIHDALAPGGRFALNTFVPDPEFVAEHYGEWDAKEVEVDGETYTVESRSDMADTVELVSRFRRRVLQDGEVLFETDTPLVFLPRRHLALLFEVGGFSEWSFYGGFDREPLESPDQELVAVARR